MDPARYLPLLEALFVLEPRVFVIGGIAEDALLNGSMTRDHWDVDMFVLRDDVPVRIQQLAALGFPRIEVKHEALPGLPMVYEGGHGDLHVALGPIDELSPGGLSFVAPGLEGPTRVYLPDDTLAYPATEIDGTPIQTVSPLALFLLRAGLAATGALGPLRGTGDGDAEATAGRALGRRARGQVAAKARTSGQAQLKAPRAGCPSRGASTGLAHREREQP